MPSPRLNRVMEETAARRKEALRVYRPMPHQMPFHLSPAKERVVRGGKRSGKTCCAAMEFASIVTGIPMLDPDGNPLPMKHRISTPDDPLLFWVIGYDSRHIGETLYHKLFMPGLFRIILDENTGEWRPFNEADPRDTGRMAKSEPVGPAIPRRMIKEDSWVWENKAENYFKSVELTNGARIHAYISSNLHPKQGDAVHGIFIDEDIQRAGHLKEWQDRITSTNGWLFWSAWPHGANPALIGLLQRAKAEVDDRTEMAKLRPDVVLPPPKIEAFKLKMTDNEYISEEGKENALARMGSDDEQARRNEGETLMDQLVMYDFMPSIHLVKPQEHAPDEDHTKAVIENILHKRGELPHEWTRYLSIDPSNTRTAIHVGTVPPPQWNKFTFGNLIIVERELVLRKMLADDIAKKVLEMIGTWRLEAMVMDQNAGRQTHAGRGDSTAEFFSEAFMKVGIEARTGKSTFIPGCNVPTDRYAAVRSLLRVNAFGAASLLFVDNKTVHTQKEFLSYTKKTSDIDGDQHIFDEPENPRIHDCMASLEYLVTYLTERFKLGNAYVAPTAYVSQGSAAYQFFQKYVKPQQDEAYTHLGPGKAA
jgi:hypothetical protein